MHSPKRIARAFLVEADVDLKVARLAYINSFYSRSIFFSQETSEKVVKACLVIKDVFTKERNASQLFRALYGGEDVEDFDTVCEAVVRLERYGAKARTPLYQRPDLPIWMPSRALGEAEASRSLEDAEVVYNRLREVVELRLMAVHG